MMMVCIPSSLFAFELSSNHYGGYGKLLKGKQTYKPSKVFPFNDAIQVNADFKSIFYTEKLPAILTEDISKFYLYTKGFKLEETQIMINDTLIDHKNISIEEYYKNEDTLQVVEIIVSNKFIRADEAALVTVTSSLKESLWIYRENISNHFTIFPTQIVYKKKEGFVRTYALISHCTEKLEHLSIDLRNTTFKFNLNKGFQIQTFTLPLLDKNAEFTAKVLVNGLVYGTEDIIVKPWEENSIYLIPYIDAKYVSNYSSEWPLEINPLGLDLNVSELNHDEFSRLINYSIDPSSDLYRDYIGFYQEEDVFRYSTLLFDQPYPSRLELNRMMDLNIKSLGYFQREKHGYPETYFNANNTAYVYEHSERELLIYKQYARVEYKDYLEHDIIYHTYKLSLNHFPFKQSLIFVDLTSVEEAEKLKNFVYAWNDKYQSPQLNLSNFNEFGRLFMNRNRTKLDRKIQVESPYRLSYRLDDIQILKPNWESILNQSPSNETYVLKKRVFNPSSESFSGIISIKHPSTSLAYAQWSDGTRIKLQQYKTNHYFVHLPEIKPFEIKTLVLVENAASGYKSKSNYLSIHKRTGVVNWQYKGNKLAKKKQKLFAPVFYNGVTSIEPISNEGYFKGKGDVFSEYERSMVTKDGQKIIINTFVFNDIPMVKYQYKITPGESQISTHLNFNFLMAPTQYSLDRIYKEEFGYSKFGNHNVLESDQSIFLINKTKMLLSSPQNLRWQYNNITYNTNDVGFVEPSTFPTRLNLLLDGELNHQRGHSYKNTEFYTLDVLLGEENENLAISKTPPIVLDYKKRSKSDLKIFRLDNDRIEVVNIHPTEKGNQYVLELKNTSDSFENANFTPAKNKSTVYECYFSGKKTGIIKGKIEFAPQELKTIRITL